MANKTETISKPEDIESAFRKAIKDALSLIKYQGIKANDIEGIRRIVGKLARVNPELQAIFDRLFFSIIAMLNHAVEGAWETGTEEALAAIEKELKKEAVHAGDNSLLDRIKELIERGKEQSKEKPITESVGGTKIRFALGETPPDESNIKAAQHVIDNPDKFNLLPLYARLNAQSLKIFQTEFMRAVREGINPYDLADRLIEKLNLTKAQAETLARTTIMDAHRTAIHTMMNQNSDVVKEWQWDAELDHLTCPVCWAMDGTRHPLKEEMKSHPNCRCVPKPVTKTASELGWTTDAFDRGDRRDEVEDRQRTNDERFAALPERTKRSILGNGRYELYSYGTHDLKDFIVPTNYFSYGPGLAVKSLKSIGYDPKTKNSSAQNFTRGWVDVENDLKAKKANGLIGETRYAKARQAIKRAAQSGEPVPPRP